MGSQISVTINQAQMERLKRTLRAVPGGLKRVIPPAINRTATQARTVASRALSRKLQIAVGQFRKRIRISKATRARWSATMHLTGKRIPTIHLGARPTNHGVTYRSHGGRKLLRHAFITYVMFASKKGDGGWDMGQTKQVFFRKGKERLPIVKQWSVSVAGMYSKASDLMAKTTQEASVLLQKNIDQRVRYLLMKA